MDEGRGCERCGGSGEQRRVVNPDWPAGEGEHVELTGESCPGCEDCAEAGKS